jgi:hypothetical protein
MAGADLRDSEGQPYNAAGKSPPFHVEGLYLFPEPTYRRADLETLGSFDVAFSHERFGYSESQRYCIVSQAFYQKWRRLGLRAHWVPVRITEDSSNGACVPKYDD